jgi:hypothetical protein
MSDELEVLAEHIEAKDTTHMTKIINHYVNSGRSKIAFSSFIVNIFCTSYLSRNLWTLKEFASLVSYVENCSSKKDGCLAKSMNNLCRLLAALDVQECKFYRKGKSYIEERSKIDQILYSSHREFQELIEMKSGVQYEIYSLLNTLYYNFAHCCDLPNCFIILRHIITSSKKQVIQEKSYQDGIDVIFLVIMKYLETNRVPSDVKEYITICKDLFFYRCKVKDRLDRVNVLFYAVYILMNRSTKFQEVEYKDKEVAQDAAGSTSTSGTDHRHEYLYVVTPKDPHLIRMVKEDRERPRPKQTRQVTVKNYEKMTRREDLVSIIFSP